MLSYEANNTEEPCAGKPHAGICEGGGWVTGRPTSIVYKMNEVIKTISILLNASVQMEEIGHNDRKIESFIKNPIDNIWQSYKNIIGVLNTPYWSECAVAKCEELLNAGERVDISGDNFVREHVVPKRIHVINLREIFKNKKKGVTYNNKKLLKEISEYLENNHLMCMITKDENERFKINHQKNKTGVSLESDMPPGWKRGCDPWARYVEVGIKWVQFIN